MYHREFAVVIDTFCDIRFRNARDAKYPRRLQSDTTRWQMKLFY